MPRTPLYNEHIALGAKMTLFAGWDMPIQYAGIIAEHMSVRQASGAFDVSHMGDFLIRGKGAAEAVSRLSTNRIEEQPIGRCVYSHILDDGGRILDDTIFTVLGRNEYLMVPNAATTPKMRKWVEEHLDGQEFYDMSMDLSAIAVQGPTAKDVVAQLTSADLSSLKSFWGGFARLDKIAHKGAEPRTPLLEGRRFMNGDGPGVKAFISRTGYTGEDGFEIVMENPDAVPVWRAVLERGRPHGLVAAGLGARDTLRLEKGLLLSGTDFDGSQTSLQTGPGWVVDWSHDFIGKDALERQRAAGNYDKLVCMMTRDRGIPRHGYEILREGRKVGVVTSGTMSPVLRTGIAMGYVPLSIATPGTALEVRIRDTLVPAEIVKPPFVRRE